MAVGDLGDYDVQAVEGNPFGSMASSPNDYDVQGVDHDPFASNGGRADYDDGGGVYREPGGGREYITPKQSLDLTSAITDEQGKPLGATKSQVPPALPGVPPLITGLYRTLYPTPAETGELPPRYWPNQPADDGGRVGYDDGGGVIDLGQDDEPVDNADVGLGSMVAAPDQFELAARRPEATPSSAGGMPMDPHDRDMLIKTIYGEASGEPALGQAGVAHAIFNRLHAGGYGGSVADIVTAPAEGVNPKRGYHEFSPWNTPPATEGNPTAQHLSPDSPSPVLRKAYGDIGSVVDKAYSGLIPDPTGGATHYFGRMRGMPKWAPPLAAQNLVKIGGQTFVGREHGPGQSGYRVAGGYQGGGGVTARKPLSMPAT